jgi:P pilus assembly chaperone PapD
MRFSALLTSLFFIITAFFPVHADMVLSKVILDFDAGSKLREDVEVKNTGKETLYISVKVLKIIAPHRKKPKRRELRNPRSAGLLVSPNRFKLRPGQSKLLRIVVRKPATRKDLIYRVTFKPRIGKVKSNQPLALKILIAYDMLVIVRPPNAKPKLRVKRSGRTLTFYNAGNTNVLIRKLKQCNKNKSKCIELPGNRLYARERWQVKLPQNSKVYVYQSIGTNHSIKQY